ncbi:MAG: hypothetical protein RIS47_2210 [Bacteroidota bacterium]|jgi:lipopolysaccharide export system permease protein
MFKILDRYILGKFLGTFFYSLSLIISIAVIFDYSEKIDDFIEHSAPWNKIIFEYYLNFIPYYANLFSFLFIFIAVIFFTSKMATRSEIVSILASGISFRRMLLPYFVGASVLALLSFGLSAYIIPRATKVRFDFEEVYYRNATANFDTKDFHRQTRPGEFIYLESYNTSVDIGYKFSIENFENGALKRKLLSDHIRWDSDSLRWMVYDYYIRVGDSTGRQNLYYGYQMDTVMNFLPSEFKRRQAFVETMNIHELDDYLDESILAGTPTEAILVEKYKRFASPFSAFILTLIGVTVASRKSRRGTGVHIGIGLALSFGYIVFQQISAQFGIKGGLSPFIAVWIPNATFTVIAIYLYRKAPK